MKTPRWPVGALFSWTAGRPGFSAKQQPSCALRLRTYSVTTFAPHTPARLPGIGDLLKIN